MWFILSEIGSAMRGALINGTPYGLIPEVQMILFGHTVGELIQE